MSGGIDRRRIKNDACPGDLGKPVAAASLAGAFQALGTRWKNESKSVPARKAGVFPANASVIVGEACGGVETLRWSLTRWDYCNGLAIGTSVARHRVPVSTAAASVDAFTLGRRSGYDPVRCVRMQRCKLILVRLPYW
jgi:hypothetical protein